MVIKTTEMQLKEEKKHALYIFYAMIQSDMFAFVKK